MSVLPTLEVITPGFLTTVQDMGRLGYQHLGMPICGVMDTYAASVANILVGCPRSSALLEITLTGPTFRVLLDTVIAASGAQFALFADDRPLAIWHSSPLRAGQTLRFGGRECGARAYLAVAGGIAVPPVMGSRSTFLRGTMGGYEGRALRPGDVLAVYDAPHAPVKSGIGLPPDDLPTYANHAELRVLPGPHAAFLTDNALFTGTYTLAAQSDRMGYRLDGPAVGVHHGIAEVLLSEATPMGAVQITGSGQPLLLMADRQTTGGYPLAAVVIAADLPCAAQLLPGQTVSFRPVILEEAHGEVRRRERYLRLLEMTLAAVR